ncbi:hypothetical protein MTO96_029707 [Rhipicephalus appendiculatus]
MFKCSVLFFAIIVNTVVLARRLSPVRLPQSFPQRKRPTTLAGICRGPCIRYVNGSHTGCHPRCQCVVTPRFGQPNAGRGQCTHALLSNVGK